MQDLYNQIQNLIEKEPSFNDESIGSEKQNIGISSDGSHSEIHASPSKRLNKAIGNVIKRLSPNKCDLEKNICGQGAFGCFRLDSTSCGCWI